MITTLDSYSGWLVILSVPEDITLVINFRDTIYTISRPNKMLQSKYQIMSNYTISHGRRHLCKFQGGNDYENDHTSITESCKQPACNAMVTTINKC